MNRELQYMEAVMANLNTLIHPRKQHLYHLLLGRTILGTYTSKEDMENAASKEWGCVACLRYIPPIPPQVWACRKIQILWRKYRVRLNLKKN